MPSANILDHSNSSSSRMPSLLLNSTTVLARSYRSLSPLTKSKSEDIKARIHVAVRPPRRQISGTFGEDTTSGWDVRHREAVERLHIAGGGVDVGVNVENCLGVPVTCCSYTSMSAPHRANQQTHDSPILSETAPYENDGSDSVSLSEEVGEPDSEECSAGSSFSTDRSLRRFGSLCEVVSATDSSSRF
jgi:hypothetical protein